MTKKPLVILVDLQKECCTEKGCPLYRWIIDGYDGDGYAECAAHGDGNPENCPLRSQPVLVKPAPKKSKKRGK